MVIQAFSRLSCGAELDCLPKCGRGCSLQRHNTENSKQIFPEKELAGVSPNFHIHVSVREWERGEPEEDDGHPAEPDEEYRTVIKHRT
jgi:hypothetical protein